MFRAVFDNAYLSQQHDGAILPCIGDRIAMTTDTYVVTPLFFRGGDIGKLALCGTINDLLMTGSIPRYISVGFVIDEGFAIDDLQQICQSMQAVASAHGIYIVTGDTKVIEARDNTPGLIINTTGIGEVKDSLSISPFRIQAGDAIIVSNDIGRHGMTIMAEREGLQFEHTLVSDCASLQPMLTPVFKHYASSLHCLRDLTRGGLASACIELATSSQTTFVINEAAVPVISQVQAACELLGLDPLYVANEGCCVMIAEYEMAQALVECLRQNPQGQSAVLIGQVESREGFTGRLVVQSPYGTERPVSKFSGEQLPRIC